MSRKLLVNLLALYILGTFLHFSSANNEALKKAVEDLCNSWDAEYPPSSKHHSALTHFQTCIEDARYTETEAMIVCAQKISFSFILGQMNGNNIRDAAQKCLDVFIQHGIPEYSMPTLKKLAGTTPYFSSTDNETLKQAVVELCNLWDAEYPPLSEKYLTSRHYLHCIDTMDDDIPSYTDRILVCAEQIYNIFLEEKEEIKNDIKASAEKCFVVFIQHGIPEDTMLNLKKLAGLSLHSTSAKDEALKNAVVQLYNLWDTEHSPLNVNFSTSADAFSICMKIEVNELPSDTDRILACAEGISDLFLQQNNNEIKNDIKDAAMKCLTLFRKNGILEDKMPNLKKLANK